MTTMKTWKENTDMDMQANTALKQPERFGNQALESLARRIRTAGEKLGVLTVIVAPLCRPPQETCPATVAAAVLGGAMTEQVQSLICLMEDMVFRIDDIIERLEFGAENQQGKS